MGRQQRRAPSQAVKGWQKADGRGARAVGTYFVQPFSSPQKARLHLNVHAQRRITVHACTCHGQTLYRKHCKDSTSYLSWKYNPSSPGALPFAHGRGRPRSRMLQAADQEEGPETCSCTCSQVSRGPAKHVRPRRTASRITGESHVSPCLAPGPPGIQRLLGHAGSKSKDTKRACSLLA